MTQWFTIARVLPERLGLNGSSASAEILAKSLREMGHEVSVVDVHGPADAPGSVDIVTMGSGSSSQVSPAATELIGLVRVFSQWKKSGAQWVAIGMGWDLLGESLITADGDSVPGAGVFPPGLITDRVDSPAKFTASMNRDANPPDTSTTWDTASCSRVPHR